MKARVGIVTVTYNSGTVLPDFLRSLAAQTHADHHLFAVDNASKDDSCAQLEAYKCSKMTVLRNSGNVGVAAGNNQGIQAALDAGCTHVLLLNNDVWFAPDMLAGLLAGLERHECALAVPLMYYADPAEMIWCAGGMFREDRGLLPVHFGKDELDRGQYSTPRPITYAPTCCTMIKREVFEQIGLMDERFFVYSDDLDFMYRALRAGLVTYYVPEVKLWHKVSSLTGAESPFSQRYMARNRAFFIRKHLPVATLAWYTVLYRCYYLMRFMLRRDDWATMLRKERAWGEGLRIA